MERYQDKAGVTLVELLIVISVLSVLVSLVLAGAGRLHNQGKERLIRETFSLLDGALEEYRDATGVFPVPGSGDASGTQTLWAALSSVPGSRVVLGKVSRRLVRVDAEGELPKIYDPWDVVVDYSYAVGDNFPLFVSAGPDRIFGTPDDITNR
jgi:prepilin-type N-terminal cleavage/methylation domain-containing protein